MTGRTALRRVLRRPSVCLFLAVEAVIWITFLSQDLQNLDNTVLKYVSILLCAGFALAEAAQGGDPLMACALVFTAGADTFLLLLDRNYGLGVCLFIVVQSLYLVRLFRPSRRTFWPLRVALFVAALIALQLLDLLIPVNVLALFYFTEFASNVALSFTLSGTMWRMFSLGLSLFLCCDLCVGAFNQPGLIPDALYDPVRVGMWFFYLPAQVLIVLSAHPDFLHDPESQTV